MLRPSHLTGKQSLRYVVIVPWSCSPVNGGLIQAFKRAGWKVETYELYRADGSVDPLQDLSNSSVVNLLCSRIKRGDFKFVHLGTPCSSFSALGLLFSFSSRTRQRPQGAGTKDLERLGNLLLRHSLMIVESCILSNTFVTLENPKSSLLWLMPGIKRVLRRRSVNLVTLDQCEFGLRDPISSLPYRKGTNILSNMPLLSNMCRKCSGSHVHQEVLGNVCVDGKWASRASHAGVYPSDLCDEIVKCVNMSVAAAAQSAALRRRQLIGSCL